MANARYEDVNVGQEAVTKSLNQIRRENEVAVKLRKQMEHEMIVLEERKAVSILFYTAIQCFNET